MDNMEYQLTSPIYIFLKRKRTANKKISLNLNWYRNEHHQTTNTVKRVYNDIMKSQITALPAIHPPIAIHYELYLPLKCDGPNFKAIISKFFCDALVKYSSLQDDDVKHKIGGSWWFAGYDKKNPRCEITITNGAKRKMNRPGTSLPTETRANKCPLGRAFCWRVVNEGNGYEKCDHYKGVSFLHSTLPDVTIYCTEED